MGSVDVDNAAWHASISEADMVQHADNVTDTLPGMRRLPALVPGPFGGTQSPILMTTQVAELLSAATKAEVPDHLTRLSDWLGAIVFGPAGPIGRIVNLHVETDQRRVRDVTLAVGSETYQIPISAIRSFKAADLYAVTEPDRRRPGQRVHRVRTWPNPRYQSTAGSISRPSQFPHQNAKRPRRTFRRGLFPIYSNVLDRSWPTKKMIHGQRWLRATGLSHDLRGDARDGFHRRHVL